MSGEATSGTECREESECWWCWWESKASTGELMNSAIPFHLFSCVCSVKFLSAISVVVKRHTQMHHFSLRLWSLNFPLESGGRESWRPSPHQWPWKHSYRDSISDAQTEAVYHHITTVAERALQLSCFSETTPWRCWGHCDPSVLLAWLQRYQKLSLRMKTALLFGLGERVRFHSGFR